MERSEVDDHVTSSGNTLWTQTTLYELIESIGRELGSEEAYRIEGIMLCLGAAGRLRSSRRWARIRFESPV